MHAAADLDLLRNCPLFAGQETEELADIAQFMRPIRAAAGTRLFTQGATAEGMYLIESGRVRIVARLPGDRVVELGRVGPGEMFGEVALVIHSQHSTSAEAIEPVRGRFLSRLNFEMLRNDQRPSAFRTMNAITDAVCGRIRKQIAEMRTALGTPGQTPDSREHLETTQPHGTRSKSATPSAIQKAKRAQDLDLDLLRQLPLFAPYSDRELKAFLAPLKLRHVRRGTRLFGPGDAPGDCLLVLRGALRTSVVRGKAMDQLAILGPASLEGDLALMDGLPQATLCEAREDVALLEMDSRRFQVLREGGNPLAFKFFESVNRSLVGKLRKHNRHLALLAVQGRIQPGVRQQT